MDSDRKFRVWDFLTKLGVAVTIAVAGWVVALNDRVHELEFAARRAAEALMRQDSQNMEIQRKFDRILETLEVLGTRLTKIETKLEQR